MSDEGRAHEDVARRWGSVNDKRLREILDIAGPRVLDVGCASGGYVAALTAHGHEAAGLDIAFPSGRPDAAPSRCLRGSALDIPFPEKSFDTAVLVNVLEHVDDRRALKEVRRVVRGNAFISVPHVMPDAFRDFEAAYPPYVDPTHLRYYTPETLTRTLEEEGFRVVRAEAVHPVNVGGLFLSAFRVPHRVAKAAGGLMNRVPGVRRYHYNVHAVAEVA